MDQGLRKEAVKVEGKWVGHWRAAQAALAFVPKCGHKEPHVAGQPCNQKSCPKCGTTMTRG